MPVTPTPPNRKFRSLFSVLCSLFSVLCSLFSALCSLLSVLCSLLSVLCSLLSALCSLLSVLCSLFSALCSLLSVLCSLLSVLCSLLSVLCSLFSALCSLFSALCSLLSVLCSLLSVLCSLFSALCSLFSPCPPCLFLCALCVKSPPSLSFSFPFDSSTFNSSTSFLFSLFYFPFSIFPFLFSLFSFLFPAWFSLRRYRRHIINRRMIRQIPHPDVSQPPRVPHQILHARNQPVLGNHILARSTTDFPVPVDIKHVPQVRVTKPRRRQLGHRVATIYIAVARHPAKRSHKRRVAHSRRPNRVKRRRRFQAGQKRGHRRPQAVPGHQQLIVDRLNGRQQWPPHFPQRVVKTVKHLAPATPIHQRRVHVVEQIRGIIFIRPAKRHHRQLLARVGIVMNRQETMCPTLRSE